MDLFRAIARWVVPRLARLVGIVVVALFRLPWHLLRAGPNLLRALHAPWGGARALLAASSDTVRCSRCGREQSLLGRWRCPVCKGVETTHAWAPCGICGAAYPAGFVACDDESCGEAIVNPRLGHGAG